MKRERESMSAGNNCPLSPALLRLLQTSVDNDTTDAKILAALLGISPATVRVEFQRIFALIGVDNRSGANTVAIRNGWVNVVRGNSSPDDKTE